jgi:hypothetical protein
MARTSPQVRRAARPRALPRPLPRGAITGGCSSAPAERCGHLCRHSSPPRRHHRCPCQALRPPLLAAAADRRLFVSLAYIALAKNTAVDDALALPALAALQRQHAPPLLQPLDPQRRSEVTAPAVLAMHRPAFFQQLLRQGLQVQARWAAMRS